MNGLTQPGAFYSAPDTDETELEQPRLEEHGEIDRANVLPATATPPPYLSTKRFTDTGVDTFAPSSQALATGFEPQLVTVAQPPLKALPVIAAVLFGVFILFEGGGKRGGHF